MTFVSKSPGKIASFELEIDSHGDHVVLKHVDLSQSVEDLLIPSIFEYDGKEYPLRKIARGAFAPVTKNQAGCTIETLVVPSSVYELQNEAFANSCGEGSTCRIKKIVLPDSISVIPFGCFKNSYINELVFNPKSVSFIQKAAFMNTNIKSLTWPSAVKSVPEQCFKNSTIKEISGVENVTEIKNSAFLRTNIESLDNFLSITSIQANAFRASALHSVSLPKSCKKIGSSSFSYCQQLIFADLSNVKKVGESAFKDCLKLKTVVWNRENTNIAKDTFSECRSLEQITGIENVIDVGPTAFCNAALNDISIFKSLRIIGQFSFTGCCFKELVFSGNIEHIDKTGCFSFCRDLKKAVFPNSTKKIDLQCFNYTPCKTFDVQMCDEVQIIYDSSMGQKAPKVIFGTDTVVSLIDSAKK